MAALDHPPMEARPASGRADPEFLRALRTALNELDGAPSNLDSLLAAQEQFRAGRSESAGMAYLREARRYFGGGDPLVSVVYEVTT